jgi:hypothetical protein
VSKKLPGIKRPDRIRSELLLLLMHHQPHECERDEERRGIKSERKPLFTVHSLSRLWFEHL